VHGLVNTRKPQECPIIGTSPPEHEAGRSARPGPVFAGGRYNGGMLAPKIYREMGLNDGEYALLRSGQFCHAE